MNQFNDLGDFVAAVFANVELIGNYEKPSLLGEFEVYVRSLGFKHMRDELDRFILYKRS